jgi:DNA-directed RNA polymerase alpha subunit
MKALLPNPFEERNKAIVADWESGMFMYKIGEKYGISRSRVSMLIRYEYHREKRKAAARRAFEETKKFEDLPIDAADLQVRTINCLINLGCKTIGEALQLSDMEMLEMPNFGRVSMRDWKSGVERLRQEFAEKR